MTARKRQPERVTSRPLSTPYWSGVLSRTDTISGSLICSSTGWRLALTAAQDGPTTLHITGQFDGEVMGDDAAPWTDEADLAKPHVSKSDGYVCFWTGTIKREGGSWSGEMADRYGGRLHITGKTQAPGVISLRATAMVAEPMMKS